MERETTKHILFSQNQIYDLEKVKAKYDMHPGSSLVDQFDPPFHPFVVDMVATEQVHLLLDPLFPKLIKFQADTR